MAGNQFAFLCISFVLTSSIVLFMFFEILVKPEMFYLEVLWRIRQTLFSDGEEGLGKHARSSRLVQNARLELNVRLSW